MKAAETEIDAREKTFAERGIARFFFQDSMIGPNFG